MKAQRRIAICEFTEKEVVQELDTERGQWFCLHHLDPSRDKADVKKFRKEQKRIEKERKQ